MEIAGLMPQANNMLQHSVVCFSCLTIQVKWTTAASSDQNSMKQLENILEKSVQFFFKTDQRTAYIIFYAIPSLLNLVQ